MTNDLRYYSAQDSPFSLHGFAAAEGYCRLPSGMFPALRPEIIRLAKQTAGGRVRFATDANEITIRISLSDTAIKTHMTPWNMSGAELYCGSGSTFHRVACLRPAALGEVPFEKLDGYCLRNELEYTLSRPGSMETMTLYLPAFTGIEKVAIDLPSSCSLIPAKPYTIQPPIVFYGSSITQGACAGRPSLSYPARVCAELDADFINLGMAGNALAEKEIAEYISGLPMSAFVLDYDHNAPTVAYLQGTHRAFFEIVRQRNPNLPILIISRPSSHMNSEDTAARYEVIRETYLTAVRNGDQNVTLLDGRDFFPADQMNENLMDFVHPNDFGFHMMTQKILPALKTLLS